MTNQQHEALLGIVAGRSLIAAIVVGLVLIWPLPFYQAIVYSVFAYVIAFIWHRWLLFRRAALLEGKYR